jgi:serine O-acetyltransferase
VQAVVVYRFGQWARLQSRLLRCVLDPMYWTCNALIRITWGIELPRGAKIGPGLYIGHFGGITISAAAVIGRDCNLSHGITIGVSGHGEHCGVPTIGDEVFIAPGARLFGRITVGNNVKIGANAVIHKDVPNNAVVVLDPGSAFSPTRETAGSATRVRLANGAAAPALRELRPELLAADADPVGAGNSAIQDFMRARCVHVADHPKLHLTFRRRKLAHGGRQHGVTHQDLDALGLKKVPGVVDGRLVEGAVDALQRSNSVSHLAAQMKSFSDRPPMAWVQYSTRHLL